MKITRNSLYTQQEALKILSVDRVVLNKLVKEKTIQRIKSSKDKRYSYYLKEQIDNHVNKAEEFYIES